MGPGLHSVLKHSDHRGKKIINHKKFFPRGCAEATWESQVCRLGGQVSVEDEGPTEEGPMPVELLAKVSGSN